LRLVEEALVEHIQALKKRFALLKTLFQSDKRIEKETLLYISNPIPIILCSENEDLIELISNNTLEYQAKTSQISFGSPKGINLIATDTNKNRQKLVVFLRKNGQNIPVILFDGLQIGKTPIVRDPKEYNPILNGMLPAFGNSTCTRQIADLVHDYAFFNNKDIKKPKP